MKPSAEEMISALGLQPHPEGGFYRETFRAADLPRGTSTSILFLLRKGECSQWHRVDADEHWLFQDGDALKLEIADDADCSQPTVILGRKLGSGAVPQAVVPRGWWQRASSLGDWTLVGCVVAPAFEFKHFELAPDGWEPSASAS